jgi:aryl-alcohol dehydrogenase-like predicted oxidoreductase
MLIGCLWGETMTRIKLGTTNLEVSSLCLGADSIGSKIDRDTSFQLLDLYRERGGTFIDTANIYAVFLKGFHGGESETTIGLWMKDRGVRDEMVISSKTGFEFPGFVGGLGAEAIKRECDASLRRLQTDRLDIYLAHCDDSNTSLTETMEAFYDLIRAGKVRAIGASNLHVWRIAQANSVSERNGWARYSIVQQRHTYLRPRYGADLGLHSPQICIGDELRHFARQSGIGLIGYSVLLQGAYMRADRPLPRQYAGPDADARINVLRGVASETGATVNQVVIAWMLQSDPLVLPIIAGSQISQLTESLGAVNVTLNADQLRRLDTAGNP